MKEQRLEVLNRLKKGEITEEQADSELLFLYNVSGLFLGEDSEGNEINPNDIVLRDMEFEERIEFGRYRDLYGCGRVIGYYVPDHCKVIKK